MKMNNMWCCEGLKHAFEERRSSGIFVYAEPPIPKYDFGVTYWIGMRSVDIENMERYLEHSKNQEPPPGAPLPNALLTGKRIEYCPWCGKKLDRHYKQTYTNLVDEVLSNEHQFGV